MRLGAVVVEEAAGRRRCRRPRRRATRNSRRSRGHPSGYPVATSRRTSASRSMDATASAWSKEQLADDDLVEAPLAEGEEALGHLLDRAGDHGVEVEAPVAVLVERRPRRGPRRPRRRRRRCPGAAGRHGGSTPVRRGTRPASAAASSSVSSGPAYQVSPRRAARARALDPAPPIQTSTGSGGVGLDAGLAQAPRPVGVVDHLAGQQRPDDGQGRPRSGRPRSSSGDAHRAELVLAAADGALEHERARCRGWPGCRSARPRPGGARGAAGRGRRTAGRASRRQAAQDRGVLVVGHRRGVVVAHVEALEAGGVRGPGPLEHLRPRPPRPSSTG